MAITDISIPLKYVFTQATEPDDKTEGKLWYNTSDNSLYTSDGTDYVKLGIDTTFFNEIFNNSLDILDIQAQETLDGGQSAYMVRDLFTDADGFLDTVDTGNTTAYFSTSKYKNTNLIVENTSTVSTTVDHSVYKNYKTISGINDYVDNVTSEFSTGDISYAKINFNYTDTTSGFSTEQTIPYIYGVFTKYTFENPNKDKEVSSVEVWFRRKSNSTPVTSEKNTKVYNCDDLIIQSSKQDLNIEPSNFQVYSHKQTLSGTGNITASVSFDNGANYQTVNLNTTTTITDKGDEMILKLNLNAGASNGFASCEGYGVMFW